MGNGTSGWAGWSAFAGIMMIVVGFFQALVGFVTLFNTDYLVITSEKLLFVDITTWAWAHLILAVIVFLAGFAVLSGAVWGRFIGVILAVLSLVANLAFIPAYPIWSILIIVIDLVIIYSLIIHGHELRNP